jgi:hypothetical protein
MRTHTHAQLRHPVLPNMLFLMLDMFVVVVRGVFVFV